MPLFDDFVASHNTSIHDVPPGPPVTRHTTQAQADATRQHYLNSMREFLRQHLILNALLSTSLLLCARSAQPAGDEKFLPYHRATISDLSAAAAVTSCHSCVQISLWKRPSALSAEYRTDVQML